MKYSDVFTLIPLRGFKCHVVLKMFVSYRCYLNKIEKVVVLAKSMERRLVSYIKLKL